MDTKISVKIRVSRWIYIYLAMVELYHLVIVGGKPNMDVISDTLLKAVTIEYDTEK